jgi:hypothetical protein
MAEKNRRRELEEGFNGITDELDERIRTIKSWPKRISPSTSSATNR